MKYLIVALCVFCFVHTGQAAIISTGPNGIPVATPFTSISPAVSAAGSKKVVLTVTTSYAVNTLTIPSNVTLRVENSAVITVNSGQTLTINAQPDLPPDRQCFAGAGAVVFGYGTVDAVRPEWYTTNTTPGTTDMTAAFQWAEIARHSTSSNPAAVAPLKLESTTYLLSAPVIKRGGYWIGNGAAQTIIRWGGADTDVAVTQSITYGNNSAGGFKGIYFSAVYSGATLISRPAKWIVVNKNAAGYGVDKHYILDDIRLRGAKTNLIDIEGFVNLHWSNLRFDDWDGYAMRIRGITNQFLSSFLIDGFTSDNMLGTATEGVFQVEDGASCTNAGVFVLSNARIEFNTALATGKKAVINHVAAATTSNVDTLHFHLNDISIQDIGGTTGMVLLNRDATGAALALGTESLTLSNVQTSMGTTPVIIGGDLIVGSSQVDLPVVSYSFLSASRNATTYIPRQTSGVNAGLHIRTEGAVGKEGLTVTKGGDAYPKMRLTSDGYIYSGDGSAAPSLTLNLGKTGWSAMAGVVGRIGSGYNTTTITTAQLASLVNGLITDLISHHGLLKP